MATEVVVVVVVVRTLCNAQVSVQLCAQMQLIKKASTIVLASSAGLSSRNPYACSLREQVPGVPKCSAVSELQSAIQKLQS